MKTCENCGCRVYEYGCVNCNEVAYIEAQTMADAAEMLWVVLANVSGGDWAQQTPEWQKAAARWRDNYFAALKAASTPTGHGEALPCVCTVEDGLVQEWVSKARAVAKSKGYEVRRTRGGHGEARTCDCGELLTVCASCARADGQDAGGGHGEALRALETAKQLPEHGQRVLIWLPSYLGGYWRESKFLDLRMPGPSFEGYYGPWPKWWMPMPPDPALLSAPLGAQVAPGQEKQHRIFDGICLDCGQEQAIAPRVCAPGQEER